LEIDYNELRKLIGLPKKNKKLSGKCLLSSKEIDSINKKLLLNLKTQISYKEVPIIYNKKFPSIINQNFNDILYLKKTNETVRWFLNKDLDS
jgi:hypothetical protein